MTIEEFGELTKEGKGEVTAYTKLEELQEKLGKDQVYCEVYYQDDSFKEMFGDALIRED